MLTWNWVYLNVFISYGVAEAHGVALSLRADREKQHMTAIKMKRVGKKVD